MSAFVSLPYCITLRVLLSLVLNKVWLLLFFWAKAAPLQILQGLSISKSNGCVKLNWDNEDPRDGRRWHILKRGPRLAQPRWLSVTNQLCLPKCSWCLPCASLNVMVERQAKFPQVHWSQPLAVVREGSRSNLGRYFFLKQETLQK